ncbi:MAG: hypothetical protein KIT60_21445 [Burkholderiaceae bacterium]|nr:hypothetical protein [Burkholderiaceae bacterium]
MKLELLPRVAAASAVVAMSAQCHALAADAVQACSKLLPKGGGLPAAPLGAIAEPVRASALLTSAQFAVTELRTGDGRSDHGARLLAFSDKGGASKVFAELRATGASRAALVWNVPAQDGGPEGALRRLAVFEHLYAFVLREPPLTLYDVRALGGGSETRAQSQPDLLGRLAQMRNCAAKEVAQTGGKAFVKTWEMPLLTRPVARGTGRLDVSARVTYPAADGHSGSITIARGSCLACSTQVGRDGGAACTLVDSHGHADAVDDVSDTTVVTYSGVVERTRIVLSTTRVDIGRTRSFARRHLAAP